MTPTIDRLLFTAATHFSSAAERRAFLEFACRGDSEQLARLESLLALQDEADAFFEPPSAADPESIAIESGSLEAPIGPYRLIDRLGSGGWGVVYLAEQQKPVKRKVALKIIRLGMDTEHVISRFNLEREALALMDHPNIARVLDAGATATGRPYFVMELVEGEKITDFCDRNRLGLRQRLELFILVCDAIQHAHQKGVVHRDIKPSNILVREDASRIEPKVIDFGIAKATAGSLDAESTATTVGQFIGTPAYVSPEQAAGSVDIDTRSDIFSLGALLCELLTGSPPLAIKNLNQGGVEEIRELLIEADIASPSVRLKSLSKEELTQFSTNRDTDPQKLVAMLAGDLDWIVMKAIEKDRQRRYGTANGLAMDVKRYLREEPVLARPPSRRYLLTKLIRRNRVTFTAAAVALFGLLGGLGISTWLFIRERDARNEQVRLRNIAEQATANEIRLRENATAADLVRQAAVFVKYNDLEQADRLLEGVPAELVPRSLEAADTYMRIANWNLVQHRWKAAARRFYSLGHVLTSVDMNDSEYITFDLLSVVTAMSEWGEPGQFEEIRELIISRFATSANPIVAEQVLKAALLEPADEATLKRMTSLRRVLEKSIRPDAPRQTAHMTAWRQFSLAMMAFRQGRWEAAEDFAKKSIMMASNSDPRTVSNQLILAMIDLKRGHVQTASESIAELRREVDSWMAEPFQLVNPDRTLWYNQGAVVVLMREAERMLRQKSDDSSEQ